MIVYRVATLVAVLTALGQPALASGGNEVAAKRPRMHASKRPEASAHLLSDFIRGSPAQKDMEQRDNDLATTRPVDHRKDEFFSDWRGLR